MLSHDLAKLLLARRNNDLKIEVIIEEYDEDVLKEMEEEGTGFDDRTGHRLVDLRDGDLEENPLKSEFMIDYDPTSDCIVIKGGTISVVVA
jgi:hypothetical protein